MKDSFEAPIALALLVCDSIITDAHTGKKTLVNLFNTVGATKYPHVIPQFYIFASMTNSNGEQDFKIRLQSTNGDTVCELPGKIPFNTPLDAPELIFFIQNLVIKSPGTYDLQIVVNDIPIASRLLTFKQIQPPQPRPQQS